VPGKRRNPVIPITNPIPHPNRKDITGKRFGKLTVLADAGTNSHREHVWLCRCECGREVQRTGSTLRCGKSVSCGCNVFTAASNALRAPKPRPGAALRRAYAACERAAKVRGLGFLLSLDDFTEITAKNCFYCGASPEQIKKTKYESYLANGIDRKDNNEGYSLTNCVPCCWPCNQMKLGQGIDEFLDRIRSIANLHGGALFQRRA
jgi:hypothetical protein